MKWFVWIIIVLVIISGISFLLIQVRNNDKKISESILSKLQNNRTDFTPPEDAYIAYVRDKFYDGGELSEDEQKIFDAFGDADPGLFLPSRE